MKKLFLLALAIFLPSLTLAYGDEYTQSIQVTNILANTSLTDPGMTPTTVLVKYYNGGDKPCWSSTLKYHAADTIHAGPRQGCVAKVNRIEIVPIPTAEKLTTYAPTEIQLDTNAYSSQIIVTQDADASKAPEFDTQSGLVTKAGTIGIKIQLQFMQCDV